MRDLLEMNIRTIKQLDAGEISSDDVIEMMGILTYNYKPWQSTWWKQKRKELIADHCVQCGSTEGPLVLQHLSHPFNFRDYYSYGAPQELKFASVVIWLQQNIRYLSFVDAVTFCKKCAFLWDKKKVGRCLQCGKWLNIKFADSGTLYFCIDCWRKGAYETDKV